MNKKKRNSSSRESFSLADRVISCLAALVFFIPTSGLLWLLIAIETAIWIADDGYYIGKNGFIALLFFFIGTALILPNLFPSLLGWVWRFIIKQSNGDYGWVHFFAVFIFLLVFYFLFRESFQ